MRHCSRTSNILVLDMKTGSATVYLHTYEELGKAEAGGPRPSDLQTATYLRTLCSQCLQGRGSQRRKDEAGISSRHKGKSGTPLSSDRGVVPLCLRESMDMC